MSLAWVKVTRSDGNGHGNNIYVDGNFVEPAGIVGEPFKTNTGSSTFETLDDSNEPDWRATEIIIKDPGNSEFNPARVILKAVKVGSGP
jgi:hypothetical protein